VVIAHELVHHGHKNDQLGVIVKSDYEKAYDRVSWDFLFSVLTSRGFSEKWIGWIKCLVKGGSVGINLNGEESPYFKPGKGLRQGNPIYPLLFNLVGDVLTKMLMRAENSGLIKGLMPEFREGVWYLCNMQMTPSCSLIQRDKIWEILNVSSMV
jgi:hypothetical protein